VANPQLSLILCSRNDNYMGNSIWRLETCLNYVAARVEELGRESDVEVLVTDWGSEVPLSSALTLTPRAAHITRFLTIPRPLARAAQGDSPFSEVHALNAAARRAKGKYVGRIDQDTLVGADFLRVFFDLSEGRGQWGPSPLEKSVIFAHRRRIPFRIASKCPPLPNVERFLRVFGRLLAVDTPSPGEHFYKAPVGIWLAPKRCWDECRGYDERYVYWGMMEVEMIKRVKETYPLLHYEEHAPCSFYHLEHYHVLARRATDRQKNPKVREDDLVFRPNGDDWGLGAHALEPVPNDRVEQDEASWASFVRLLVVSGLQSAYDSAILFVRGTGRFVVVWSQRAALAWQTVRGKSWLEWPRLLADLWVRQAKIRAEKTQGL
jgi:hypothetical protein